MKLPLALIVVCIAFCGTSQAQGIGDRQGAGLFVQSCIKFAGQAPALRSWAAERHLPPSPEPMASELKRRDPGASVFVASSPGVQMALISLDNGVCRILMQHGDADRVEGAVFDALAKAGVGNALIRQEERGGPAAKMRLYKANFARQRYWSWSVVSKEVPGLASGITEVTLTAESTSAEQWIARPVLPDQSHPPAPN